MSTIGTVIFGISDGGWLKRRWVVQPYLSLSLTSDGGSNFCHHEIETKITVGKQKDSMGDEKY